MGCDIHAWLAILSDEGKWEPCGPLSGDEEEIHNNTDHTGITKQISWGNKWKLDCLSGRDYRFFGVIAGVRYPVDNPIAEGRNWPENIGSYFKPISNNPDLHSKTWITLPELKRAFKRAHIDPHMEDCSYYSYGLAYRPIEQYINERNIDVLIISSKKQKFRIFIAFDN